MRVARLPKSCLAYVMVIGNHDSSVVENDYFENLRDVENDR